jgi:hypothetical protein
VVPDWNVIGFKSRFSPASRQDKSLTVYRRASSPWRQHPACYPFAYLKIDALGCNTAGCRSDDRRIARPELAHWLIPRRYDEHRHTSSASCVRICRNGIYRNQHKSQSRASMNPVLECQRKARTCPLGTVASRQGRHADSRECMGLETRAGLWAGRKAGEPSAESSPGYNLTAAPTLPDLVDLLPPPSARPAVTPSSLAPRHSPRTVPARRFGPASAARIVAQAPLGPLPQGIRLRVFRFVRVELDPDRRILPALADS